MSAAPANPDPVDAARHGEEVAGVVGPTGLMPDAEVGLTFAETAEIEHAADASGVSDLVTDHEPEMGVAEVRRMAMKGIGAIFVRTLGLRTLTFGGNIVL